MIEDDPLLTITDLRRVFCSPGITKRLARAGVDVQDFMKNGALASSLMGRGYDAHVQRAVDAKRALIEPPEVEAQESEDG